MDADISGQTFEEKEDMKTLVESQSIHPPDIYQVEKEE